MKTYQEKVLDQFERIANKYGCEAVTTHEPGATLVLAQRGWATQARVSVHIGGGHNRAQFNGATRGPDGWRIWAEQEDDKVRDMFTYWADLLYEGYRCDECDQHHRPGGKCQW